VFRSRFRLQSPPPVGVEGFDEEFEEVGVGGVEFGFDGEGGVRGSVVGGRQVVASATTPVMRIERG